MQEAQAPLAHFLLIGHPNAKTAVMNKITIYQFTDPVCAWCWGNEPVMRAIDYLYGDRIDVEFIMGGLVEDIATMFEDDGRTADAVAHANDRIRKGWIAASARHGMPVRTEPFTLFSSRQPSSFPQNIAFEAAKRLDPAAAKRFLRRLREATFAEARPTAQIDVLIELATEAGLDATEFVDEYTHGNAQADFMQDRTKCRRNGITGFPSYLIKNGQTSIILGGYQNLATFHTVIRRLSDGRIKPRKASPSPANVADFVRRYTTVYPVEIETVFGIDRSQTDTIVDELIRTKRISAEAIGDGRRLTIVPKKRPAADRSGTADTNSGRSASRAGTTARKRAAGSTDKRGDAAKKHSAETPVASEA